MVELDLVTLDREKIIRTLTAAGVDKRVIAIFDEMHDTTRVMQKALEEVMDQQNKIIEALQIMNSGFKLLGERQRAMEKKYGISNVTDILKSEQFDG